MSWKLSYARYCDNVYHAWGSTSTDSKNCKLQTLIFKYKTAYLRYYRLLMLWLSCFSWSIKNLCQLFSVFLASLRPKTILACHDQWSNIFLANPRPKILFVPAWLTLFRLNMFTLSILRLVSYKILSWTWIWNVKMLWSVVDRKSRFKLQSSSFLRMCCLTHTLHM